MDKPFPSRPQSIGITFLIILSMLVFAFFYMELQNYFPEDISMLLYYIVAIGVPALLLHFKRKKEEGTFTYPIFKGKIRVYLLLGLVGLGLMFGVSSPIASLLPMSDWIREAFMQLANQRGWVSFMMIAIAAPILEEYIFRGIILEGLLKRYSAWSSILLSSFLFGLVHLNPWQFISAMIIGVFAGWIYYKSRNLLYPIFIHFVNNATAFVFMQFQEPEKYLDASITESYGGLTNTWLIITSSIILALLGIWGLNKALKATVSWNSMTVHKLEDIT